MHTHTFQTPAKLIHNIKTKSNQIAHTQVTSEKKVNTKCTHISNAKPIHNINTNSKPKSTYTNHVREKGQSKMHTHTFQTPSQFTI